MNVCFIAVARSQKFDVVLVDTAGRMQDNEPLMKALAKVGWLVCWSVGWLVCYIIV